MLVNTQLSESLSDSGCLGGSLGISGFNKYQMVLIISHDGNYPQVDVLVNVSLRVPEMVLPQTLCMKTSVV